jgi:hypothetical protein
MSDNRNSELARLRSSSYWNYDLHQPRVAPDSIEEDRALSRIDELREDELDGLMQYHPDAKSGTGLSGAGPFYRRSATSSQLGSRRAAATRYWRKHTR